LNVAHHFCAISTEIARAVHSINIDSVVPSVMF
jgi:hypothetical protein